MVNYHTTTNIWLHLEDFYNKGLTPEKAKELIESIKDPCAINSYLKCHPMGINHNWIVECYGSSNDVYGIVYEIECVLNSEMTKMRSR